MKELFSFLSENEEKIPVYGFIKDQDAPFSLLMGTMHGDEIEGAYLIGRFLSQNPEPKENMLFIPCVNPDGVKAGTRENAHRIDLNRNYPTQNFQKSSFNPHSGRALSGSPASESETQGILALFNKFPIGKVLSIHSDLAVVDFDGPAEKWAGEISKMTGYPLTKSGVGYPTPGSFGTWAGIERQIPVITLETHKARTEKELEALWLRLLPLFEDF